MDSDTYPEGGALPVRDRAVVNGANELSPPLRASVPSAGFALKAWDVTVSGYGTEHINAATRGAALAKAWMSDAFNGLNFGQFLKIASARRSETLPESFGDPITVCGKPAYYVGRNRAYVQIAYPGEGHACSAHPYDILPVSYRPVGYRHAQVIETQGAETLAAPGEA